MKKEKSTTRKSMTTEENGKEESGKEIICINSLRLEADAAEKMANEFIANEWGHNTEGNPLTLGEKSRIRLNHHAALCKMLLPLRKFRACKWLADLMDNYARLSTTWPYIQKEELRINNKIYGVLLPLE
jgi:hypothetical protein